MQSSRDGKIGFTVINWSENKEMSAEQHTKSRRLKLKADFAHKRFLFFPPAARCKIKRTELNIRRGNEQLAYFGFFSLNPYLYKLSSK